MEQQNIKKTIPMSRFGDIKRNYGLKSLNVVAFCGQNIVSDEKGLTPEIEAKIAAISNLAEQQIMNICIKVCKQLGIEQMAEEMFILLTDDEKVVSSTLSNANNHLESIILAAKGNGYEKAINAVRTIDPAFNLKDFTKNNIPWG